METGDDQPTYLLVQQNEGQESGITEARTADGSIIQLRQITSSGTIQNLQGLTGIKTVQTTGVKRPAQSSGQVMVK